MTHIEITKRFPWHTHCETKSMNKKKMYRKRDWDWAPLNSIISKFFIEFVNVTFSPDFIPGPDYYLDTMRFLKNLQTRFPKVIPLFSSSCHFLHLPNESMNKSSYFACSAFVIIIQKNNYISSRIAHFNILASLQHLHLHQFFRTLFGSFNGYVYAHI